jgi:hypothetical protein
MQTVIHFDVTAEPDAFHGGQGGYWYALHVTVERVADAGGDTEGGAKEQFETFLDWVAAMTPALFVPDGPGNWKPGDAVTPVAPGVALDPDHLKKWFTDRSTGRTAFYLEPTPLPDAEVEASDARAAALLRATKSWTAPVPQALGLTRLLSLGAAPADGAIFLPGDLTDLEWTDGDEVTAKGKIAALGDKKVEVRSPKLDKIPPVDVVDLIGGRDGTVKVSAKGGELHALMGRIGARGGELLSPFPAFLGYLEGWVPGPSFFPPKDQFMAMAKAAVTLAFDPVLLALAMPGDLRGPVLQEFLASVEAEGGQAETCREAFRIEIPNLTPEALVRALPKGDGTLRTALMACIEGTVFDGKPPEKHATENALLALRETLSALEEALNGEEGVEAALGGVLQAITVTDADLAKHYPAAVAAFRATMAGPWNGADAVRQALGQLTAGRVVATFHGVPDSFSADEVTARVEHADYFARRVGRAAPAGGAPEWIDGPLAALPAVQAGAAAEAELADAYKSVAVPLLRANPAGRRFRPLPAPPPLAVAIAPPLTEAEFEDLSKAIQGYGIVVSARSDKTATPLPGHACLTTLKVGDTWSADPAIRPLMPAVTDGAPFLFAEYNGRPFAGAGDAAAGWDTGAVMTADERAAAEGAVAFATGEPWAPADEADERLLPPPLAYGFEYAARAFWVPNSGALPNKLRGADAFTPGEVPEDVIPKDAVYLPYHRQTPIAETMLASKGTPRIDIYPADVIPLCDDYPRQALSAFPGARAFLDIGRAPDGSGSFPAGTAEVRLKDFRPSGVKPTVALHRYATDTPEMPGMAATWRDETGDLVIDTSGASDAFWVRLTLDVGAGPAATVSFSDEDAGGGRPATVPRLLIAKQAAVGDVEKWRRPFRDPAEITVTLPQVAYEDFDRFHVNRLAFVGASGIADELWAEVGDAALASVIGRAEAARAGLAPVRLPDPMVWGLMVSLEQCDTLDAGLAEVPKVAFVKMQPYAKASMAWTDHVQFLKALDDAARTVVMAQHGDSLSLKAAPGAVTITVPEGVSARLTVRPLVPESLFNKVIDPQMRQWAVGVLPEVAAGAAETGRPATVVFEGAALRIEAMTAVLPAVTAGDLEVLAEGAARGYAMARKKNAADGWRAYAFATVHTQRWEPTGRPFYKWVAPSRLARSVAVGPVMHCDPNDDFTTFAQAVIDRDRAEANPSPPVRLAPVGHSAPLQRFDWAKPSATLYRHRVTAISRYAGAMQNPAADGQRELSKENGQKELSKEKGWDAHVAVLADAGRVEMPVPKVRAYLPLTGRVAGKGAAAPVLSILSERPYGEGGLAERLGAQLVWAVEYRTMDQNDRAGRVQVARSLRTETGPSPELSIHPVASESSRGWRLTTEGPVGLQLERQDVGRPSFPNSELLIHPEGSVGAADEHFLQLGLMRWLDPDWTWVPEEEEAKSTGRAAMAGSPLPDAFRAAFPDGAKLLSAKGEVMAVNAGNLIQLTKEALGIGTENDAALDLCAAPAGSEILCARAGETAHWLHVFGLPKVADEPNGRAAGRPLLASFMVASGGAVSLEGAGDAVLARVSSPTPPEWVRLSRDLSVLSVIGAEGKAETCEAKNFEATISGGKDVSFTRDKTPAAPESPAMRADHPRQVMRHMAAILTERTLELGRGIEVFRAMVWVEGDHATVPEVGGTVPLLLRLAEIETPSAILTNVAGAVGPWDFKVARFDPWAFGGASDPGGRLLKGQLRMTVNFLTPLVKTTSATVTLVHRDGAVELTLTPKEDLLRAVVEVDVADGGALSCKAVRGWTDKGTAVGVNVVRADPTPDPKAKDVQVTITIPKVATWWTEVALLWSGPNSGNGFDLDWLLPRRTGDETDVRRAARPAALTAMPEAQARLIAVSPPMDVARPAAAATTKAEAAMNLAADSEGGV